MARAGTATKEPLGLTAGDPALPAHCPPPARVGHRSHRQLAFHGELLDLPAEARELLTLSGGEAFWLTAVDAFPADLSCRGSRR